MKTLNSSLLVPILALSLLPLQGGRSTEVRGFTAESARVQRDWEAKFRAIPDTARQRAAMRHLASRPHHLGSPYGKANAEWLRDQFRSFGWDARIDEYQVLFPTPTERLLEMVAPTRFVARLDEPVLREDPSTGQKTEQLPSYNAFAADGDVTGPLVYVNYGVPADYEELARRGVSVQGAIVIARYGGSWRGIKPKVAAEHGAIGCIIYSDPRDDGYAQGDVYPAGPWRPKDGVQRGSVLDLPVAPGDPLTVGVGATRDAPRVDRKDAATIMKIPVLPISYADAQPLLSALSGPVAPEGWRGSLPITYHMGPGPARVRLRLAFNWTLTPLYNVIATLRGTELPDEWVVRGNHHDGWVNGAQDPLSGMVAELEEARALGELVKQGWRPRRTIVYAAWDGEEPALLGSTEWVEDHAAELQRKAVFYLNTDSNGRGYLGAGGSHSLEKLANQVAREIEDPESGGSVWRRVQAARVRFGSPVQRREARERPDLRIDALGSGSDYTPFLQHLGVATLNLGFGGEDGGGIYHSIYDTFAWYSRFGDTAFVYGRALAQTVGSIIMRMSNADILPHDFTALAETVRGYVAELKALREEVAARINEVNRQLDDGVIAATTDPRFPEKPAAREAPAPHLNFAPLDNGAESLTRAASRYERAFGAVMGGGRLDAPTAMAVNALLRDAERTLTSPDGLPLRPWYRHLLYAPGYYTGYGVKTMPSAREAIEQKNWVNAEMEIARIAAALERAALHVTRIAERLEGAAGAGSRGQP
jgi:N-acetylated-alpha-linked acidic dipeptidase